MAGLPSSSSRRSVSPASVPCSGSGSSNPAECGDGGGIGTDPPVVDRGHVLERSRHGIAEDLLRCRGLDGQFTVVLSLHDASLAPSGPLRAGRGA